MSAGSAYLAQQSDDHKLKGMTTNGNTKSQFSWRAFVSVLTAVSFIGMTLSGIILFVMPPGRIANRSDWTLIALTKEQWTALHLWFSLVFVAAAAWHVYLNWKLFASYFKNKASKALALHTEWMAALIVCIAVLLGTLADIKPFSSLSAWNESIKQSWDNTGGGGQRGSRQRSGKTERPTQLTGNQPGRGGGFGQMTLSQYCNEMGLDKNTVLKKLQDAGFKASHEMTVREIADTAGVHPSEIRTVLGP